MMTMKKMNYTTGIQGQNNKKYAERRSPMGILAQKQRRNHDNPGTFNSNRFKILAKENNIGEKGEEITDYTKYHQFLSQILTIF